jgi:hypothetical protein
MLEKQQKNKKGKKVHAVFYQVGFILILKKCVYTIPLIDLFILKNMGTAIIDFRVCPPLVKCQNIMFSGFIETLMYGFSSTGVTIYCYYHLYCNKLNTYMSQIKHFTADRSNPFTHRYHILTIRK